MQRTLELAIVLAAIVLPPAYFSKAGDNYGKHDAERGAKIVASQGVILAVYKMFQSGKSSG